MIAFDRFAQALPLAEFLNRFGTPADRTRWENSRERVTLTQSQHELLTKFQRRTNILVLAGAWCGDCAAHAPILEKFAEIAPLIAIRYLDRDSDSTVQVELKINGGHRVPVAVFFSEDGHEVARFGEKTLTEYRHLVSQLGGESYGSGIPSRETRSGVIRDWLDELERVQCILRLSPRLRRLHSD